MKTSEMIAMLEKNPKLKFTNIKHNAVKIWVADNGYLTGKHGNNPGITGNIKLDGDWQLIREPVTWQEALQAWAEGKTVKCILDLSAEENRNNTGVYQGDEFYLVDSFKRGMSKHELEKGTWYILEDTDHA